MTMRENHWPVKSQRGLVRFSPAVRSPLKHVAIYFACHCNSHFFLFVFLGNFCDCAKDSKKCIVCNQGLTAVKLKTSRPVTNYIEVLAAGLESIRVYWFKGHGYAPGAGEP